MRGEKERVIRQRTHADFVTQIVTGGSGQTQTQRENWEEKFTQMERERVRVRHCREESAIGEIVSSLIGKD